ncbi:MAG: hypothetical protein EXR36_11890 [Betaproteobacteria bacterium]|nr:hypothetical protein [Betaproteobacteria bacterium]
MNVLISRLPGAVILGLALVSSVVAETDEEEQQRNAREAVERVVNSHDHTLILNGGHLMIKQQAVRAAHKLLVQWGKEENLGPKWWEDRPEWKAAKAELIRGGDMLLARQFLADAWLKKTWTEYTTKEFSGEQADVIASHFETEGGEKQRLLMEWYLGEMVLFYYTFTDRFDYEVKETQDELHALQKQALRRIPAEDTEFASRYKNAWQFIACSPDSRYCPGLHYWKMLAIPLLGSVFRHMEDTTRAIEADMRSRRPQMQRYFDEFRANSR